MPTLLLPLGLAALAALAIPLILHLARRSEDVPTDFAALRWLSPRPKPRRRPKFDEWPLLATRLALLALLALWLARPVLSGSADLTPWALVVPGIAAEQAQPLVARGAEGHWLAPGFPPLEDPAPAGPIAVASLLRQADAELLAGARLSLFVPATIDGADAERPRLTRAVDWHVVPGPVTETRPPREASPPIAVRYAPEQAGGVRYLRAAAAAWQPAGGFEAAPAQTPLRSTAGVVIWLAPGPLPEAVRLLAAKGGTVLTAADTGATPGEEAVALWRDAVGAPLIEGVALGRGRLLRFTRALTPAAMPELVDPSFPTQLRAALTAAPPEPTRVAAQDYAPLPGGVAETAIPMRDLQPWLALLIAGLLVLERWLATRSGRAVAP
jgi:hypothetical protein